MGRAFKLFKAFKTFKSSTELKFLTASFKSRFCDLIDLNVLNDWNGLNSEAVWGGSQKGVKNCV